MKALANMIDRDYPAPAPVTKTLNAIDEWKRPSAPAVRGPLTYAPPHLRGAELRGGGGSGGGGGSVNVVVGGGEPEEPMADQVKSFGELPTRELDQIVSAAEAEIAALKLDAQAIRDMYVKHTNRVAADIDRLREGIKVSMVTLNTLRQQITDLDAGVEIKKTIEATTTTDAAADAEMDAAIKAETEAVDKSAG